MFGSLTFRPFDYVVIPRCTTYRLEFDPASEPDLLIFESAGDLTIPARYLNPDGQLRLGGGLVTGRGGSADAADRRLEG